MNTIEKFEKLCDIEGYSIIERTNKTNDHAKILHNKCGYVYNVTPSNFVGLGIRCPRCAGKERRTTERIKEMILEADPNYELIDPYVNSKTKLHLRHKVCEYDWYVRSSDFFIKGTRCPKCRGKVSKTQDEFVSQVGALDDEYEVVGEYKGTSKHVRMRHKRCGYEWEVIPYNFTKHNGTRCPKCQCKFVSMSEKELYDFIVENYNGKVYRNIRYVIDPYELDIYLPDINLAFEYNGLYWHDDNHVEKDYHLNKTKMCEEKGIQLIQIFDDEWKFKKDIVKSKILRHLVELPTIYARKLVVGKCSRKDKRLFLNKNHIQGNDRTNNYLALLDGDKIMAIMTFKKGNISKGNKDIWELSRFACRIDLKIIGAFDKLIKYCVKEYNIRYFVTYADRRYSTRNNIYSKLTYEGETKPNYWYTDGTYRFHRFDFRKSLLKKKLPKYYDDSLSEKEIVKRSGLRIIYDCGHLKYSYNLDK